MRSAVRPVAIVRSKHTGHRGAKGRCASNCRHFDPQLNAASAMAALTAGIAAGDVTPGEAAELSTLVEAYVKASSNPHLI